MKRPANLGFGPKVSTLECGAKNDNSLRVRSGLDWRSMNPWNEKRERRETMERANGWIKECILMFVVITLFLQIGHLLASAAGSEPSKAVFYVH